MPEPKSLPAPPIEKTAEEDGYVSPLANMPPSAELTELLNIQDGQEKLLDKILADELPDRIKNNPDIINSNFAFINKISAMTNIPPEKASFFEQKTRDYYRSLLNHTDLNSLTHQKIASMKNMREFNHFAMMRSVGGWERDKQKTQIVNQKQEVSMPPPEQPSPRNNGGGGFANFLFNKGGK